MVGLQIGPHGAKERLEKESGHSRLVEGGLISKGTCLQDCLEWVAETRVGFSNQPPDT